MKYAKLLLIAAVFALLLPASPAKAFAYDKTHLIDDNLFTDTDSMSVAEIQAFLDSQGSLLANWVDNVTMRRPSDNCIVHHPTGMTAAEIIYQAAHEWGAQVYYSSGPSDDCAIEGAYWSDPGYSNYVLPTISPKAILVTLQKEQSLVTADGTYSTDPNDYKDPVCCSSNEYKLARAMGYAVPDSGSINEKYLGFYNQVNWGAWQLRFNHERAAGNLAWDEVPYLTYSGPLITGSYQRYDGSPFFDSTGYWKVSGGTWTAGHSGDYDIFIDNQATAALYYYTPHFCDAPGPCGNYNFVAIYNQWFGPTIDAYQSKYIDQSPHPTIKQGGQTEVWLKYQNDGGSTWYDTVGVTDPSAPPGTNPVVLATANPVGRKSVFGYAWGTNRKIPGSEFSAVYESDGVTPAADQHVAEPGQIVKYQFYLDTPLDKLGVFTEKFHPIVKDNQELMNTLGSFLRVTVVEPNWQATHYRQGGYPVMYQGYDQDLYIDYKNTGDVNWYDTISVEAASTPYHAAPVVLATASPIARKSVFGYAWGTNRKKPTEVFSAVYESDGVTPAADQHVVEPGQIGRFSFTLLSPHDLLPKRYYEKFTPILSGFHGAFSSLNTNIAVKVKDAIYQATFYTQSAHPVIAQGSSDTGSMSYKNTGNVNWYDDTSKVYAATPDNMKAVWLATNKALLRKSIFGTSWSTNRKRPALVFAAVYESDGVTPAADQHVVEPGQIAKFNIEFTVPNDLAVNVYKEHFQPYNESYPDNFNRLGSFLKVNVTP